MHGQVPRCFEDAGVSADSRVGSFTQAAWSDIAETLTKPAVLSRLWDLAWAAVGKRHYPPQSAALNSKALRDKAPEALALVPKTRKCIINQQLIMMMRTMTIRTLMVTAFVT